MDNINKLLLSLVTILVIIYIKYGLNNNNSSHRSILTIHKTNKIKNDLDFSNFNPKTYIDISNTNHFALFVGKPKGEADQLLVKYNGQMIDISDQIPLLQNTNMTYAAVSVDINHNGYTDLIVAREDGVTLYLNKGNGEFEVKKLLNESDKTIPISLTVSDYNKDGNVDIYVSQYTNPKYLLKNPNYVAKNILFEGLGLGMFEDVTDRTMTSYNNKNTLRAKWIDINSDKLPDLVLDKEDNTKEYLINTRGASGSKYINGPTFYRKDFPQHLDKQSDSLLYGTNSVDSQTDTNVNEINYHVLHDDGSGKHVDQKKIDEDLDHMWDIANGNIINRKNDIRYGGDLYWLNIIGQQKPLTENHFIGIKVPNNSLFLNAKVHVASINDVTGKITKHTKDVLNDNVIIFNLGKDNRVLHLEVYTIYDSSHWIHPNPKIDTIATFRNMS